MTDGTLLQVNLVAADHPVWSGKAKSAVIPAAAGAMGILPDHEPVLTLIDAGKVVVRDAADERHAFDVTDGFISFDSNLLTIAVERANDVVMSKGSD